MAVQAFLPKHSFEARDVADSDRISWRNRYKVDPVCLRLGHGFPARKLDALVGAHYTWKALRERRLIEVPRHRLLRDASVGDHCHVFVTGIAGHRQSLEELALG